MHYLFMDEKGPQNSFKISDPFDKKNKLSYANDNMHSYVANVIQIEKTVYGSIEKEYCQIVETYLSTRKQLQQSLKYKTSQPSFRKMSANLSCSLCACSNHIRSSNSKSSILQMVSLSSSLPGLCSITCFSRPVSENIQKGSCWYIFTPP